MTLSNRQFELVENSAGHASAQTIMIFSEQTNPSATMQLDWQWLTGSLTSGISIWKEITGSEV